ncbi:MAG TPA: hypothetical protein VHW26_03100 [Solirubrobacteraceae bacterium]|nr:hypothetical protein [Solirubrobacteraceae bacterium]
MDSRVLAQYWTVQYCPVGRLEDRERRAGAVAGGAARGWRPRPGPGPRPGAELVVGAEASPGGVLLEAAGVLDRRVDATASAGRRGSQQQADHAADADSTPLAPR